MHSKGNIAFVVFLSSAPSLLAGGAGGDINANATMVAIAYVCLLLIIVFGAKFAWKPILGKIDEREQKISKGLEDATKSTEKLAEIEVECKNVLYKSQEEAKTIIVEARKVAEKLASYISVKSQEEANLQKEKAFAEIEAQRSASVQSLRKESAELAIAIAGKILDKNLDDGTNRSLVENLIKEI